MRALFKMHSILGLVNGVWLLILGISGSLLVYYHEIDHWLNKETLTVTPSGERLPLDSLFRVVHKEHPEASGAAVLRFPASPDDATGFRLYIRDGTKRIDHWWDTYNMDLDPYTGRILRQGLYRDVGSSFMNWTFNLHWSLNEGPPGLLIITLAGLLLFANLITGLIIFRKYLWKVMIFRAPVKWRNWRTITGGLHRYIGVWTMVFNLLIFYSGLQMNWNAFESRTWQPPPVQPKFEGPYASFDAMLERTDSLFPGFRTTYLYVPFERRSARGKSRESVAIYGDIPGTSSLIPRGASSALFDPHDGRLVEKKDARAEIASMDPWDAFNAIVYSFHVGTFAGNWSRILYVFIGLTPALLSLSGFALWYRRTGRRPKHSAKHIITKKNIES